jgi:sulfotransferase
MIKDVFYNASFPRSGSTLLQNILAQNPDIYSSPTSGLFNLMTSTKTMYTDTVEFQAQDQKETIKGYQGFLKAGIEGYYSKITDRLYAIDKYKGWLGEYNFIKAYNPNAKVICMVRDLRSIFSSLEKKVRKNPLIDHQVTNWKELAGITTYKRVSVLSNSIVISLSTESMYQAILEGYDKHILFIKYEDFCVNPDVEIKKIYSYLDIPYFTHQYTELKQITQENDQLYGAFGDHVIKKTLTSIPEDFYEVLGYDACDLIIQTYPWFYNYFDYKI